MPAKIRSIVVGFIDTPEGHRALELAIEEALARSARLLVIHSMRGGHKPLSEDVLHYREALNEVGTRLRDLEIEHEIHEYVRDNSPAEDLLAAADEFDVDLIVMGYRIRSAAGKAILGSHAHDILMGAKRAVLAIAGPDD